MCRETGPYDTAADPPVAAPPTSPMDPRHGFRPTNVAALMAAFQENQQRLVVAGHTGWGA